MLTLEQKQKIIESICSTEPKSLCETLDLDLDSHEEDIDMFLLGCQSALLGDL